MANGRLANCLIPPYSGVELYSNTSGSSASISISTQVIDSTTNSEVTTTVGTSSTTLTAVNDLSTTGCYCRLIGYHIDSDGYYGAFAANTTTPSCPHVNRYIACDGTVTDGFTTTTVTSIPFGGSEVVNPLLRYSNSSVAAPECCPGMSAVLGFVPFPNSSTSSWALLTKFTAPSPNCAATTLVNPCCNSRYSGGAGYICCSGGFGGAINYYALDNISGGCYCVGTCYDEAASIVFDGVFLIFNRVCGCTCSSSFIRGGNISSICICDCGYINSNCRLAMHCLEGFCGFNYNCWYCNSNGARISPFGVHSAASKDVFIQTHFLQGSTRYVTLPTNYCLITSCCVSNNWCYKNVVDTIITPAVSSNCELPVKYLSYNPNTKCVYMMVRSAKSNECGIFTINTNTLCSCYGTFTNSLSISNLVCVTLETTPLYCKVADFPEIMTCSYYTSPFMCVSCIFRSGPSLWTISIYNCSTSAWDTFASTNLVDWKNTTTKLDYYESDTRQISSTPSCIYRYCNCYMSNVDYSGMIDYKISANNYERTGVVVSNGDKVFVNNNSSKCMSAQVWGYEG